MKEYDFTLKFDLRDSECDPSTYVDRLAENGCDDALIGLAKKGYISLNFIRESESACEAISSAINDVKAAIPYAVLVEASPDFVGAADIAEILGCSRQNIRQLIVKNVQESPSPVHNGSHSIWRLAEVLNWLQEMKGYQVEDTLLDVASFNMQLNIYRGLRKINFENQDKLASLVA